MRFDKMMRAVGPFVIAAARSGAFTVRKDGKFKFNCDSDKFRFNGKTGVKLEDLDMGEDLPTEVVLVGPDQLVITEGEDFAISVQGDDEAKDGARFLVDGDTLYVMRGDFCSGDDEGATITVTMPAPSKVTITGSGALATSALADNTEMVIAGSGEISVLDIDNASLEVTIAGSGSFSAGGKVGKLDLSVAGSGNADMGNLLVESADIDITGSGDATFACDGEVAANIMGSGHVTVRGSARCRVQSMGSGSLVVEPREGKAA